jgi:hypothetical protein
VITIALLSSSVTMAQQSAYEFAKKLEVGQEGDHLPTAVDASGNIYISGEFTGSQDFDPGSGTATLNGANGSMFLAKYSAAGNYLWAIAIGGDNSLRESPTAIALDGNGNVIVAGMFWWSGSGTDFDPGSGTVRLKGNHFVAKYSTSGAHISSFGLTLNPPSGSGSLSWLLTGLNTDGGNSMYVTCRLNGTVDFNPGKQTNNLSGTNEIAIAKYSSTGAFQWAKKFVGANTHYAQVQTILDASGNVYLAGGFIGTVDFDPGAGTANLTAPGQNNDNAFVAKYSATGAYQWAFRAGSTRPCRVHSLALNAGGDLLITGDFRGVVDFDPGIGTANLSTDTSLLTQAMYVARYSTSGAYLSAFQIGGVQDSTWVSGYHIASDASNNLYVAGDVAGTIDFDPGSGTANITPVGSRDIFIAKYSASGVCIWASGIGGTGSDERPRQLRISGTNIIITGRFYGTVDFDPGSGTADLTASTSGSSYVAKYSQSGLAKQEVDPGVVPGSDLNVFVAPNPFAEAFSLRITGDTKIPVLVELVDLMGRSLESVNVGTDGVENIGADLPSGTYFLRATQAGTVRQVMVKKQR